MYTLYSERWRQPERWTVARRNKFKKYKACDKVQRGCSSYKAAGPKSCLIQGISGDKNNQLRSPTGLPDVLQILVLEYNLSKKTSITEPRLQLLKFTLCVDTLVTPNLVYLLTFLYFSQVLNFSLFLLSLAVSIFRFTLLAIFFSPLSFSLFVHPYGPWPIFR
jgi:hypothetical protein